MKSFLMSYPIFHSLLLSLVYVNTDACIISCSSLMNVVPVVRRVKSTLKDYFNPYLADFIKWNCNNPPLIFWNCQLSFYGYHGAILHIYMYIGPCGYQDENLKLVSQQYRVRTDALYYTL